jgi:hypothetical protein
LLSIQGIFLCLLVVLSTTESATKKQQTNKESFSEQSQAFLPKGFLVCKLTLIPQRLRAGCVGYISARKQHLLLFQFPIFPSTICSLVILAKANLPDRRFDVFPL